MQRLFERRLRDVALVAAALVAAFGAASFRGLSNGRRPLSPDLQFDIPPFPSEVLRPFSFGLAALGADLMFLDAVQVYGGRKPGQSAAEGLGDDRLLAKLLLYAVDLDPHFRGAYRFAGDALPRHTYDGKAMGVIAAEQLLQRGVRERPDDWKIAFQLGFIQSFYLDDLLNASKSLAQAARLPGAPRFVGLLATRLAADAGEVSLGEDLAAAMEAQATEEEIKQEWHERRLSLAMERHLRRIEAAAAHYHTRTGSFPPSLQALVQSGELPQLPAEPHGGRYLLSSDGQATSSVASRLRIRGRVGAQSGLLAQ